MFYSRNPFTRNSGNSVTAMFTRVRTNFCHGNDFFLSRASNVGSRILLRKLWQNLHGLGEYYLGEYSWSGTVPVKEIGITSDLAHFADQNLHGSVGPFQNFVRTRSKRGLHLEQKAIVVSG